MNSEKKEKPRMLAATEEVDKISRSMLVWANTFPEKPVDIIKYEFLSADQGDETGMALSTIQGTYITKRFILGGYQAEYQFKLIYRIKPGRSNDKRLEEGLVRPTLAATPGDLSLVLPKRILDGIMEMIYALDRIAPGTANDDTLLYGVEVKFYNMEVAVNEHLETKHPGLYIIGDGSGITHSLSHASASGVHVARQIAGE